MPNLRSYQAERTTRLPLPLSSYSYKVRVKAGDNWLIPGRKGSGKTTFFKELINSLQGLYPHSHVYILDIKRRDFNDYSNRIQSDIAPQLLLRDEPIQVWQPVSEIPEEIETWLQNILYDAPAIVGIDEAVALSYTRNWQSEMFARMQKLGRDLPISTIVGTQELVKIPRTIISQSDHAVRFSLQHPYEQSLMKHLLGVTGEPPDVHGFWYSNIEKGHAPLYYDSMQTFFGKTK